MSIQGRDFLHHAKDFVNMSCEAGFRSATSRSYYALYHEVCSILQHCPPTTHDGVLNYLTRDTRRNAEPFDKMSLIQLGAVLGQQKTKRKKADYELDDDFLEIEAKSSIAVVEKMINKIDELKNELKDKLQNGSR
ncbi:hypothetical protein [Arsenophonus sp.]|uniref:hypothetical protein n=1 Tax=Arsenophonus sp. TaxID=1872640 RepID=UPI00387A2AA4